VSLNGSSVSNLYSILDDIYISCGGRSKKTINEMAEKSNILYPNNLKKSRI
jgi:hypothetical protein